MSHHPLPPLVVKTNSSPFQIPISGPLAAVEGEEEEEEEVLRLNSKLAFTRMVFTETKMEAPSSTILSGEWEGWFRLRLKAGTVVVRPPIRGERSKRVIEALWLVVERYLRRW